MAARSRYRIIPDLASAIAQLIGDGFLVSTTGAVSLVSAGGRQWIRCSNGSIAIQVPNGTAFALGFRWVATSLQTSAQMVHFQKADGTDIADLHAASGFMRFRRGSNVLGTAPGAFAANTEYYTQLSCSLHASTGDFEIRGTGGIGVVSATGQNTENASGGCEIIRLGYGGGIIQITDLYLDVRSGGAGTGFVGPLKMHAAPPTADTAQADLTPSDPSAPNYEMVNDIPNDGDTSKLTGESGDKDRYTHATAAALGLQGPIESVTAVAVTKTDGAAQVSLGIRSDGADYEAARDSGPSYQMQAGDVHLVDPATSDPWDATAFNATEIVLAVA